MDPDSIIIIIISLLFSAFFSGMEIAYVTSNKLHLELLKQKGGFGAKFVTPLLNNPSRFIATMLVGNNIALVVYGIEMANLIEPKIRVYTDLNFLVILIQTIISSLMVLITAEFLPKVFFEVNATRLLKFFIIPVWIIYYFLYYPTSIILNISNFFLKVFFSSTNKDTKPVFARVDLHKFVEELTKAKSNSENIDPEIQIFQNALDFSQIKARECMIPRNEIKSVDIEDSVKNLSEKFINTGLSKILVYRGNMDKIIGYIHSFELFKKPKDIKSILLPILLIPETKTVNHILDLFIKKRKSIALVIDEFGGTAGLLTIEDVVEQLFGEIEDEHDKIELINKKISDNEYIFSGRHKIDFLNEKYNLILPDSQDYETLSGLIVYFNENIPKINSVIEINQFQFEVLEVKMTKIQKVKLTIRKLHDDNL
ncbi:MAG: HlyC/CorC family transporter [Flavobacteriales bacterium TMED288]|nr:hemolysin [Flavobacteriales bacterium]RPG53085.1 MAG: HlyC/CorC family transporter [Flavobacteriales bacterium TMED288]